MHQRSFVRNRAASPGPVSADRSRLEPRPFASGARTTEASDRLTPEPAAHGMHRLMLDEEQGLTEDLMRSPIETVNTQKYAERVGQSRQSSSLGAIQVELKVGARGDPYEQEADRVADYIANGGYSNSQTARIEMPAISRLSGGVPDDGLEISESVEERIEQSKGLGGELPTPVAQLMQGRLGHDFSKVRVKADSEAADLCQELSARAFTNGSDIWMGRGESASDMHLMAHELTHVAQQGAAPRVSSDSAARSNADLARGVRDGTVQADGPAMSFAYPNIFEVSSDAVVEAARVEDWTAGEGDYRERGGWMMWNPSTSVYTVVQRRVGTWLSCDMGATPPDNADTVMVAHYHQHPPLPPAEDSALWPVRPSAADRAFSAARNSPGVVRDYTNTTRNSVTDYEYGATTRRH